MLRSEKIKNILIENNKLLSISKNVCSFHAYKNKFFYNKNQIAFFEKHEGRYKIVENKDGKITFEKINGIEKVSITIFYPLSKYLQVGDELDLFMTKDKFLGFSEIVAVKSYKLIEDQEIKEKDTALI